MDDALEYQLTVPKKVFSTPVGNLCDDATAILLKIQDSYIMLLTTTWMNLKDPKDEQRRYKKRHLCYSWVFQAYPRNNIEVEPSPPHDDFHHNSDF